MKNYLTLLKSHYRDRMIDGDDILIPCVIMGDFKVKEALIRQNDGLWRYEYFDLDTEGVTMVCINANTNKELEDWFQSKNKLLSVPKR